MIKYLLRIWLLLALCLRVDAQGSPLDLIGVTALRSLTTNLDGRTIRVVQAEADVAENPIAFEVNPVNVSQPASRFTFYSAAGSTNVYPNNLGTNSWHAEDVGNVFYGMPNGVATNLAHIDSYDADFFINAYVVSNLAVLNAAIVNQSFTFGTLTVSNQREVDSYYDDYAETFGTLFVSAANNFGSGSLTVAAPGTAYNCISVGAYVNGAARNSLGPTIDNGRCKPDLTALSDATSFSTPQVAGVAALLLQAAGRGDGGSATNAAADSRVIKALLLNGAVKPLDWTNGPATPLDARYGAGVVNALNAYEQLASGQHSPSVTTVVATDTAHLPSVGTGTVSVLSGWDFNTNSSSALNDGVDHYYFNVSNNFVGQKFLATATLVWHRQFGQTNLNDLNLFLYACANSNLVTCSTSRVDNVEHLYLTNLPAGRYDLQVLKKGGAASVSSNEVYALAFEFVAPPNLKLRAGTNSELTWPVYPAGFLVETLTNLTASLWQTDGLPAPTVTNGQSNIRLNTTNAVQFFRLRRPNF